MPELFPKIFRTFRLSDGRYVAMQISYAGYDFDGQPGNVFAHAFIFDDVDENFCREDISDISVTERILPKRI